MKSSNAIHELIKALTPTEKRYFLLSHQSDAETNKMLKLFNAVNKMSNYDESKLKTVLNSNTSGTLSRSKNYLNEQLFKSLRGYHSNTSVDIKLQASIIDIEILYRKALISQCSKKINQSLKSSIQHERFGIALTLIQWERKLLLLNETANRIEAEIFKLEQSVLERQRNLVQYIGLFNKVSELLDEEGFLISDDQLATVSSISLNPLLSRESRARTYKAKIYYHLIWSKLYRILGKFKRAVQHSRQALETESATLDQYEYYKLLINHIYTCNFVKNYNSAYIHIEYLKNFLENELGNFHLVEKDFNIAWINIQSRIYRETGDLNSLTQMLKETEKRLGIFDKSVKKDKRIMVTNSLTLGYYHLENYKTSLKWCNETLNNPHARKRPDIYYNARILFLLLQIELKNYDIASYSLNSSVRLLKKYNLFGEVEEIFLSYLRKFLNITNVEFDPVRLKILIDQLWEIKNFLDQPRDFEKLHFFISWSEKRLVNRPFTEIYVKNGIKIYDSIRD